MVSQNQPLEALKAFGSIARNPDDLDNVFALITSLPGTSRAQLVARMGRSYTGRRLLAERPNLRALLMDRASLSRLPADSLGQAYLRACTQTGISAEGIVTASRAGKRVRGEESTEIRYARNRMRDSHDLWHVVTGYGMDVLGEVAVLSFTMAQVPSPGIGILCGAAYLHFVDGVNDTLVEAYRRGRASVWFPTVPWEELLPRPLDDVRAELGLGAPPRYTPISTAELRRRGLLWSRS